jgi:hypothetical protein
VVGRTLGASPYPRGSSSYPGTHNKAQRGRGVQIRLLQIRSASRGGNDAMGTLTAGIDPVRTGFFKIVFDVATVFIMTLR